MLPAQLERTELDGFRRHIIRGGAALDVRDFMLLVDPYGVHPSHIDNQTTFRG